jgi:hypothetical protein
MTKILLEEWAKQNRIPRRTAQTSAKDGKIPATLTKHPVIIKAESLRHWREVHHPRQRKARG